MNAPQTQVAAAAVRAIDGASELDRLLQQEYSPRYMLEGDSMDKMMLLAEQMASSKLSVPEHLRGNVGDCLAIITQAMLWNMNPFAVAQKTHIVSGRLGYEAQLVIAVVQNSGAIRGGFRFEYDASPAGAIACRAGAVLRGETEVTWGEWLSSATVTTKNSPLWKVNVPQQMSYLQAKNWSRIYCPGAILGVYSADELEDIAPDDAAPPPPPRGPRRKSAAAAPAPNAAADPQTGELPAPTTVGAPEQGPREPAPAKPAGAADARGLIGTGQVNYLRNKLKAAGMAEAVVCGRYGVADIEQLNVDAFDELKTELLAMS